MAGRMAASPSANVGTRSPMKSLENHEPASSACYACQMQRLDDARAWLRRASKLGKPERIKAMALSDPDLEPLWTEIREW